MGEEGERAGGRVKGGDEGGGGSAVKEVTK